MSRKSDPKNDLNEYELQRLENIRRNTEFLTSIGIGAIKNEISNKKTPSKKKDETDLSERKRKISALERSSSQRKEKESSAGSSRRSRRLSGEGIPEATMISDEKEEGPRDYSSIPLVGPDMHCSVVLPLSF